MVCVCFKLFLFDLHCLLGKRAVLTLQAVMAPPVQADWEVCAHSCVEGFHHKFHIVTWGFCLCKLCAHAYKRGKRVVHNMLYWLKKTPEMTYDVHCTALLYAAAWCMQHTHTNVSIVRVCRVKGLFKSVRLVCEPWTVIMWWELIKKCFKYFICVLTLASVVSARWKGVSLSGLCAVLFLTFVTVRLAGGGENPDVKYSSPLADLTLVTRKSKNYRGQIYGRHGQPT